MEVVCINLILNSYQMESKIFSSICIFCRMKEFLRRAPVAVAVAVAVREAGQVVSLY